MNLCKCGQELILKPLPGVVAFPRRLECPIHGYLYSEERKDSFGIAEWPEEICDYSAGIHSEGYD